MQFQRVRDWRQLGTGRSCRKARSDTVTELTIIFGIACGAFVALLLLRPGHWPAGEQGVMLAAASAINLAGLVGIAWFEALTLPYDGVNGSGLPYAVALALLLVAPSAQCGSTTAAERRSRSW